MDYKKLEELNKLRQSGALTDEEFEREKQKMMNEDAPAATAPMENITLPLGLSESAYLALMSFLILIPYAGWLIPIILWIIGKEQSDLVNRQGKYILNWYISWFIFSFILVIFFVVSFVIGVGSIASLAGLSGIDDLSPTAVAGLLSGGGGAIGITIVILCIISVLSILFPIIGGIKGLNKQAWKYPLSIPFLK